MARQVQLVTIEKYHEDWYNKPQTVQVHKAYWSAEQEVLEVEKLDNGKYRVRLSSGEYRVLESHLQVFLETY
jgi:hypothetical protein